MRHCRDTDFSQLPASGRTCGDKNRVREKRDFLLSLSSLLQPPVLSMKLRAKGERLLGVSLLEGHLSGDGVFARAERQPPGKKFLDSNYNAIPKSRL